METVLRHDPPPLKWWPPQVRWLCDFAVPLWHVPDHSSWGQVMSRKRQREVCKAPSLIIMFERLRSTRWDQKTFHCFSVFSSFLARDRCVYNNRFGDCKARLNRDGYHRVWGHIGIWDLLGFAEPPPPASKNEEVISVLRCKYWERGRHGARNLRNRQGDRFVPPGCRGVWYLEHLGRVGRRSNGGICFTLGVWLSLNCPGAVPLRARSSITVLLESRPPGLLDLDLGAAMVGRERQWKLDNQYLRLMQWASYSHDTEPWKQGHRQARHSVALCSGVRASLAERNNKENADPCLGHRGKMLLQHVSVEKICAQISTRCNAWLGNGGHFGEGRPGNHRPSTDHKDPPVGTRNELDQRELIWRKYAGNVWAFHTENFHGVPHPENMKSKRQICDWSFEHCNRTQLCKQSMPRQTPRK